MLKHYLLISLKVLRRRPFFTFISIFGISFTLLVLMVVTALLDHTLAPIAPQTRQHLTLVSGQANMFGDNGSWCCVGGFTLYDRYAKNLPGATHLALYTSTRPVNSYVDGRKIVSEIKRTDGEFWKILDFTFLEGRPFSDAEVESAALVAVINRSTRERVFGGGNAAGQTIEADGQRLTVVGVVEDVSMARQVPFADIWTPYTTAKTSDWRTGLMGDFHAIVMVADPAALHEIHDEFNARLSRIGRSEFPDPNLYHTIVAPFETASQAFARDAGPFADQKSPDSQVWRVMLGLGTVALLFVLLPTVNLVNINVSRIMERASEIGIRKAFGASSRTLVGQFVVENVILTVAGGLAGLALSTVVLRAINQSGVIPYAQLGINGRVFIYGLLIAAVFGVVSGVYPAWRMSRLHPADALRGGERR